MTGWRLMKNLNMLFAMIAVASLPFICAAQQVNVEPAALVPGTYEGRVEHFDEQGVRVAWSDIRLTIDQVSTTRAVGTVQVYRAYGVCKTRFPWEATPGQDGFWQVDSERDVIRGCGRTLTLQATPKGLVGTLMGKEAGRLFKLVAEKK